MAAAGNGQVTLSWDKLSQSFITGFQVNYRPTNGTGGSWRDIPRSRASTTSHTITGLTNGVGYSFWVRAASVSYTGSHAGPVEATPVASSSTVIRDGRELSNFRVVSDRTRFKVSLAREESPAQSGVPTR